MLQELSDADSPTTPVKPRPSLCGASHAMGNPQIKGAMVLCSKFLLFDPLDQSLPMYKFPFNKQFVAKTEVMLAAPSALTSCPGR